ncbi:MAG: DNA-binding protein WhiA, partial [Candidatus Eremiobacteraeota bacterium]|nr:DNA-binding protein WhiA [Candidatus Eremiobacteraeota bacterium]
MARLFWTLLSVDEKRRYPLEKKSGSGLYRVARYEIEVPPRLQAFPPKPPHKCDRVMELRAAFLACGSLSVGVQGYHLEFVSSNAQCGERLEWMLRSMACIPKSVERKHHRVLYFKDFDVIVEVLSTIGAFGAVLQLEEIRALKETKNRIHRLVNTEAANLDRATAAAAQA